MVPWLSRAASPLPPSLPPQGLMGLCLPSGSMYPHPEAGNELDMDLSEDDVEETVEACDQEGGSIEEDR